jgi:ectoine hydroxylase-related dioxygenase (phytanoyl-CoA dioxygenase family)
MTETLTGLTPAEVEQFRREGYLLCNRQLFPAEKFRRLQATFERILANAPEGKKPEDLDVPHYAYPELFEWLLADEVLDVVEPLVGPDIALWSSHFIAKPPGKGRAVPWHEDSSYWQGWLEPQEVVTVWLAIDPSRRENGCMRVIPGSHSHGFSEYEPVDTETNVFHAKIRADQFDESKAVDLELEPGQFHLHHAKMIHGSNANTSNLRRCGYTMRYMSTAVKFNADARRLKHQLYLARGRDRAGNEYGDPTRRWEEGVR